MSPPSRRDAGPFRAQPRGTESVRVLPVLRRLFDRVRGRADGHDAPEEVAAPGQGLPTERKALVHRYTIDAEEAEASAWARSASAQRTAAVTTTDRSDPEALTDSIGAAPRTWATPELGSGTLTALLVLSTAAGLMLISAADALSRSGHKHGSLLFWLGLLAIFLPVTARLASSVPTRNERVGLLVLLGLASYLAKVFRDPFHLLFTDEFIHQYNAVSILATHGLFHRNPILHATPAYPGLEAPTAALSALTGMSTFSTGLILIGVARLIMMLGLFLLYETVTGSGRIAGLAAALYAASPHYLFFVAQFSYESLALPIAILALAATLRARPPEGVGRRAWLVVALVLTAGVVVTHHMTAYALVVTLLAICLLPLPWSSRRPRRPWAVAAAAIALTAGWLVLVARETVGYLSPVILGALRETLRTAAGEAHTRGLFHSSSGSAQGPVWEHFAAFASAVIVAASLPLGIRAVWLRYRHSPMPIVFAAAAAAYVGTLLLRLVPAAWETAARASEFLFIGSAFLLALATFWVLERFPGLTARIGLTVAAGLLLIGGLISTTPSSTRLAEPYRVSAHGGSLVPQAATVGRWASDVLGPGNRMAAGGADGRFLLVEGRQRVFAGVSPPIVPALATKLLYPWEIALLRREGIRYVVADRQPSGMDIANGYYFFPHQPDRALALASSKFERAGAHPIYDSGNIVVYDITGGLKEPRTKPIRAPSRGRPSHTRAS